MYVCLCLYSVDIILTYTINLLNVTVSGALKEKATYDKALGPILSILHATNS